jgi:hypothetical protein
MGGLSPDTIVFASDEQVSSRVADEEVILNLENGTYYGLDPVGARVWDLIQEPTSVKDLVDRLLEEYEVDRDQCLEDVLALLQDMHDEGLVSAES